MKGGLRVDMWGQSHTIFTINTSATCDVIIWASLVASELRGQQPTLRPVTPLRGQEWNVHLVPG